MRILFDALANSHSRSYCAQFPKQSRPVERIVAWTATGSVDSPCLSLAAAGLINKSQPHAAAVSNASGLTPPIWL